jgi:hypothetical protein
MYILTVLGAPGYVLPTDIHAYSLYVGSSEPDQPRFRYTRSFIVQKLRKQGKVIFFSHRRIGEEQGKRY